MASLFSREIAEYAVLIFRLLSIAVVYTMYQYRKSLGRSNYISFEVEKNYEGIHAPL